MHKELRLRRGLLALIFLVVMGLAPWGAVSTVQAATATASNIEVTVTATGDDVLAVQSVGTDFDVIVSGGIAPVTVTLTARAGATLVKPPSGSSSQLPFEYEVGFPLNPGEDSAIGMVRKVVVEVDIKVTPKAAGDYEDLPDPIQIAAGGFSSPVHQADVVIQVTPALAGISISLALLNGVGHERHARLEAEGQTAVGGGDVIVVQTDAVGMIQGVLTSSDSLDTCTVYASADELDCEVSQPVEFNWIWMDAFDPVTDWVIEPAWIDDVGIYTNTLRIRHHRAQQPDAPVLPLDQHEIRLFVEKVVYLDDEGEEQVIINTADDPSTNVNEWAVFVDVATTDADGVATANLDVKKVDGLVALEFAAYDWSIYREPPVDAAPQALNLMSAASVSLASSQPEERVSRPGHVMKCPPVSKYAPAIALKPTIVPVVVGSELTNSFGGLLCFFLSNQNETSWSLQLRELVQEGEEWIIVADDVIYAEQLDPDPVQLGANFYDVELDPGRNRFIRYRIIARRKGKFRAEFLKDGRMERSHEFYAVEGRMDAVGEGETTPVKIDNVTPPVAVFPVFTPTSPAGSFKVEYQIVGDGEGEYSLSIAGVIIGAFKFKKLTPILTPPLRTEVWAESECEAIFQSSFNLEAKYIVRRIVKGGGYEYSVQHTRKGTTSPIRLIAADMKIANPTGRTPQIGATGAGVNPQNASLFVFDTADNPGKCVARCEAAPLTAALSAESKAHVWSLLEWNLPDVGPVGPGIGVTEDNVTTFTYNGMPTHTDQYGNTNITLSFKNRLTWAYHQPVQFRYKRTGSSAAAAVLDAETISANHAVAGNPNWYVYWQQVANGFGFGPQTSMEYSNSLHAPGAEHELGTYQFAFGGTTWIDKIIMYRGNEADINGFVKLLHHENGHRNSYQLPNEKGGWGDGLAYDEALDSDWDGIPDSWENSDYAQGLGFVVSLPPPADEEARVLDRKRRGAWDHGWDSLEDAAVGLAAGNYTNPDGHQNFTGRGLCRRNEDEVEEKYGDIRSKDWSHNAGE